MNRALRIAMFCGLLPMVAGTSVFVAWLLTEWEPLMVAGVFVILGGILCVMVGLAAVTLYFFQDAPPGVSPNRQGQYTLATYLLLLANFPLAFWFASSAVHWEARYRVVVENRTTEPLTDVRVFGGGAEADFGVIPAGGSASKKLWFDRDGTLELRAQSGAAPLSSTVEGYVTGGLGGFATVTVKEDKSISVMNMHD